MNSEGKINTDLILRERLALQRTVQANQRTFLSFIRTSLYFSIAGFSMNSLIKVEYGYLIENFFLVSAFILFIIGLINYLKYKKINIKNERNIGIYKQDYK